MAEPTREDIDIMLRLAQLSALQNLDEAAAFVWSDDFPTDYSQFRAKFPKGKRSQEEGLLHRWLGWWETVGTVYRNGLFSEDLLFDWLAVTTAWDQVKGVALGLREEMGDPRMWENFEYMAEQQRSWQPKRP
jgi:hypothetical protein